MSMNRASFNSQHYKLEIESHISDKINVHYYDQKNDHHEFVCISRYDHETKEDVKVFISGDALETFIERMSVICALRFKNKGQS